MPMTPIIFLIAFFQSASPLPGYHTAGTEFVFGCPYLSTGTTFSGKIFLTTERYHVTYDLWVPSEYNQGHYTPNNMIRRNMSPYSRSSHRIDRKCKIMRSGLYQSHRLNASSPIHVILQVADRLRNNVVMVKLIPKETCFNKYYISALKGHVFMTVHAFGHTKITAYFSDTKDYYNESCWGDRNYMCHPNTVERLNLAAYQFWYFELNYPEFDLQNTIIESTNPVFVMAGNMKASITTFGTDPLASTMKPMAAWGKLYVIPHFFGETKPAKLVLRINAITFPFHFNVTHRSTKALVLQTAGEAEYVHKEMRQAVAVTATKAFGLHAIMATTVMTDGSLWVGSFINIIPVEQWMSGFMCLWNDYKVQKGRYTFLVLSTADPKNVSFQNYDHLLSLWKKELTIDKTTFYSTTLAYKLVDTFIFLKDVPGKLMLYIRLQPGIYTSTAFPFDFYQGEIMRGFCRTVEPIASDGVDNDCDGVIDEEIINDKDDDEDGQVDEDVVEPYRNGQWSAWSHACYIKCNDKETNQSVRQCVRSRFGLSCPGKPETCGMYDDCLDSCKSGDLERVCTCSPGCSECKNGTAVCDECVPGYYHTPYCLKKCPRGWTGANCHRGPRSYEDFLRLANGQPFLTSSNTPDPFLVWTPNTTAESMPDSFPTWYIFPILGCGVMLIYVLLVVLFLNRIRKFKKTPNSEELQEEEKEMSKSIEVQESDIWGEPRKGRESIMESAVDIPSQEN